jgi:hypothetical protein
MAHNHSKQSLANEQAASINKAIRTSYINKKIHKDLSRTIHKEHGKTTQTCSLTTFTTLSTQGVDFSSTTQIQFFSTLRWCTVVVVGLHLRALRQSCTPVRASGAAAARRPGIRLLAGVTIWVDQCPT